MILTGYLLIISSLFCCDFKVKSESSYQNNRLLYSKRIIIEILALICQQYLLKEGLGPCSLQGKLLDLLTLEYFPFLACEKAL